MNPLVAKAVLGDLTLEEAVSMAGASEIEVQTKLGTGTNTYSFRSWTMDYDDLDLYSGDTNCDPEMSIPLDFKVRVGGGKVHFVWKGMDVSVAFYRLVPFDICGDLVARP